MKWYLEYPIVYIIVFCVYYLFFTNADDPLVLRLMLSLIIGFFISAIGYAVYYEIKKKELKKGNKK
jgi:hypothetical protein